MVYVLNRYGEPLMPTERLGRVRHLLKERKAVIVNYHPFTIKLTYKCPDHTQEVSLGVDAGSKHVGLSATTKKKVLFEAQLELRDDIVKKLATRREFRRSRRHRKTRYRKSRFLNRKKTSQWMAPSIRQKRQSHHYWIDRICHILPVKHITVEIGKFDMQKMKAHEQGTPIPQGAEYQNGDQLGFYNVREFVLFRDGHKCRCCKGKSHDMVLNVHHIESRKTGGNAPNNLVTLCRTCHEKYHRGEIVLPRNTARGSSYRDAACMNMIGMSLCIQLQTKYGRDRVSFTFGYVTKYIRMSNNLPKEHTIDARCISGNPLATPNGTTYIIKPLRRHNRQLHKASILVGCIRKSNQAPKEVFGFRLMDTVLYNGQVCYVNGRRTSGYFSLVNIKGKVLTNSVSYRKLTRINHNTHIIGGAIPLTR